MSEVFKYIFIIAAAAFIFSFGYKMVKLLNEKNCRTELANFEISLKELDKSLRFGAREQKSYSVPCGATQIYFFDRSKSIEPSDFKQIPILMDALRTGTNNVFLVKGDGVLKSFYAGNLQIENVYICLKPRDEKISLYIEGAGQSVEIKPAKGQLLCS